MIDRIKLDRILQEVNKPARYIGMEQNTYKKDLGKVSVKFAFAFPDLYDIGMSHLGLHILYNLINQQEDYACERVFSPWLDMEELMRRENLPLYTLESKEELSNFDFLGFTLQYEMSYTNILNILDLSNIPLRKENRTDDHPLIIAGGPCAYNPEPLAEFIDIFVIGEGEEIILELMDLYKLHKEAKWDRKQYLKELTKIQGIYVPQFYEVTYKEDNTIDGMYPIEEGIPETVTKRYIRNLDTMYSPDKLIVPYIDTVHNRINMEIFRGCTRGCRFCQAGILYRPLREKSVENLLQLSEELVKNTGYDNISLSSLSSCDYSQLGILISRLIEKYKDKKISVSLPSLRLDSLSIDILKEIEKVRKSGLTFAPEAGSQRLRDAINKGVSEDDLKNAVSYAFDEGWSRIKLYFMIGLPTESQEDLIGIKELAYMVRDIFFKRDKEKIKGDFKLTTSASFFVPKPFTPFQWFGQNSIEEFKEKAHLIKDNIKDKKINFNYHNAELSYLEAIFARGDRRLSKLLLRAFEKGCKYDGWSEYFNFGKWTEAMKETGIDGDFYALRNRNFDEVLPWDFIDPLISKKYLIKEYNKSLNGQTTNDCRLQCTGCGIKNCLMWSDNNED